MNQLQRAAVFLIALLFLLAAVITFGGRACAADAEEHYVGFNTVSRHFTGDHEKYNEKNWGAFYERRTSADTGWQIGAYNNSFSRTTVYAVGMWQPIHLGPVDIGGFFGPATGYREGGLAFIAGAVVTVEVSKDVALQAIVNPAVVGLQFRYGF